MELFILEFANLCRAACNQAANEGKWHAQIQLPNQHTHRWDEMISYIKTSFKNEDVGKVITDDPNITLLEISWQGI